VANDLAFVDEAKARGKLLLAPVAVLWLVHLVNAVLGHGLDVFGVRPRSLFGLVGILGAPLLHVSWGHLLTNTVSLLMLGWILMIRNRRDFYVVGALSALTAGLGTWLIGAAHSVHIGASGVIFGLLGYLLSRGIFERKLWSILGTAVGLFFFGGALRGLFPGVAGISWESHLFGFLGGVLAARIASSPAVEARVQAVVPAAKRRIGLAPSPKRVAAAEAEPAVEEELESLRRKMGR
jgi:membrane associated rhomboid family serine protease